MNQQIWQTWIKNINWILEISKKRSWDIENLEIKEPVRPEQIEKLEKELEIEYPVDFKKILTEYSSGLKLNWQIVGEEPEGEFSEIFCGAGDGYLFDFKELGYCFDSYKGWIEDCFSNPDDEYDKIWHNKIPFINVPNGDIIAFGEKEGDNFPVIYLSHEDGALHGCRLGIDFTDFLSRWTNLGCIGTEDWQFEPFYDFENKILNLTGEVIDRWKKWLNQ